MGAVDMEAQTAELLRNLLPRGVTRARVDWCTRTDSRPVSLHPHELDATAVPAAARWHVSSGIAHPAGDGTLWCRIPHLALCPVRHASTPLPPQIAALCRHLALHTRRLLDTGAFTSPPTTPPAPTPTTTPCRPARPVVFLLHTRYLAARPIDTIQCVAQTSRRHRCTHTVLAPNTPPGSWTLDSVWTGGSGFVDLQKTAFVDRRGSQLVITRPVNDEQKSRRCRGGGDKWGGGNLRLVGRMSALNTSQEGTGQLWLVPLL
ncbi:DUF6083 domain-containing protein [Streptomyces sp. NPDC096354]|uniref:DUF6083 domain-containing protein n=1 Tax=Streptomyces sp. NPDC096354 TaxID=3366088 RepID=UPI00382230AB